MKKSQIVALILVISVLFEQAVSAVIPFHMDEFLVYHVLACIRAPLNYINTFREACDGYARNILGGIGVLAPPLPILSYSYVGGVTGILYYPLLSVWNSPHSARLFGVIFLAIQAALISRRFNFNFLITFGLLLSFMPYAVQHVVDTGQLTFQTTSVFLCLSILPKWRQASIENRFRIHFPIMFALIPVIGLWNRLSYVFLLPGLFVLICAELVWGADKDQSKSFIARERKAFVAATFLFLVLAYLLLTSTSNGQPYYSVMLDNTPLEKTLNFEAFGSRFQKVTWYFLVNPLASVHAVKNISLDSSFGGYMMWASFLAIISLGGFRQARYLTLASTLGALLTLFLVTLSPRSWAMHHVVLAYPFIVILLANQIRSLLDHSNFGRYAVSILLSIAIVVNLHAYTQIKYLKKYAYGVSDNLDDLNLVVNKCFAKDSVIVVYEWGMYYLKSLFTPTTSCVIFMKPIGRSQNLETIKERASRLGRRLVFLGSWRDERSLQLIRHSIPNLQRFETGVSAGDWSVYYDGTFGQVKCSLSN